MSKLVLKLSDKRSLTFDAPVLTTQSLIFQLLGSLNKAFLLAFVAIFTLEIFREDTTPVTYFKSILIFVVLSGMVQIIKAVIGGLKHLPESRFDLFSLVLLIGLISGLLVKQVADITSEGMFPNQFYWFLTIWGFLLLVLMHYFIDIGTRSRNIIILVVCTILAAFELGLIYKFVNDGVINQYLAIIVIGVAPVFYGINSLFSNRSIRLGLIINAIVLTVAGLISLPASYTLIVFSVGLVFMALKFVKREITLKDFQDLLKLRLNNIKKLDLAWENLLLFGLLLALLIGIVISIATGSGVDVIKDGFKLNYDLLKNATDITKLLIGGDFRFYQDTIVASLFRSYGLLGVILVYGFLYYGAYVAYNLAQKDKENKGLLVNISTALATAPIFAFFVVAPMELLIFHFLFMGIVAALFAIKNKRDNKIEDMTLEVIKLDKKMNSRMRSIFRIAQLILSVAVVVLGAYIVFNIDKIFFS